MNKTLRPIVICGPSGSGKSTLLNSLKKHYPRSFAFSISHTTREPRNGEENGREYHFVKREAMMKSIANSEFIEHAEYSGNLYGTSIVAVEQAINSGRRCVIDIDIQGVKILKQQKYLNPIYIFIDPPSMDELETRLRTRGTETEESLEERIRAATVEMEYSREEGAFDYKILNENGKLQLAFERLEEILLNISTNESAQKILENNQS